MKTLEGPKGRKPAVAKFRSEGGACEGNGLVVPVEPNGSERKGTVPVMLLGVVNGTYAAE